MKKTVLFLVLAISAIGFSVNAQEAGKFRGGLDLGYAIPKGGGGVVGALELKYNLKDNLNVGIRLEDAFMAREVAGEKGSISGNASYIAMGDYYFNSGASSFAPFVGLGVGYYGLATITVGSADLGGDASGKVGGVLRAGFELNKFRLAASYNLIGDSKIKGALNNTDLKSSNSYFSVTLGFYIGGGSWKK